MENWVEIADTGIFSGDEEEEIAGISHAGHLLVLIKVKEDIYALDDNCSHEDARLSEGELFDEEIYCPKHGSRFDIKTGEPGCLPAIKPVRSYPVRVEEGRIYIQWNG
jgi:nitrite reductase/ring-hydroxylating ferredoxin subunit